MNIVQKLNIINYENIKNRFQSYFSNKKMILITKEKSTSANKVYENIGLPVDLERLVLSKRHFSGYSLQVLKPYISYTNRWAQLPWLLTGHLPIFLNYFVFQNLFVHLYYTTCLIHIDRYTKWIKIKSIRLSF